MRTHRTRWLTSILCVLIAALYALPLVWLLSVSVRTQEDVFRSIIIPGSFQPSNYPEAWSEFGLQPLFVASVVVTFATVIIGVVLCVTAAYGFSRFRTRTSEIVYHVILIGLMIPPSAVIIPFFLGMLQVGLYDSLLAVIVGETAFVLAFGTLLLRGYMDHIPKDLLDAARVDGASEWLSFRKVVTPLLRPAIGTVAVFFALTTWNGFLIPLVMIRNTDQATLPVGLSPYTGEFGTQDWNLLAAAAVISIAPLLIVFIAARRSYIKGLTTGAVKQ